MARFHDLMISDILAWHQFPNYHLYYIGKYFMINESPIKSMIFQEFNLPKIHQQNFQTVVVDVVAFLFFPVVADFFHF